MGLAHLCYIQSLKEITRCWSSLAPLTVLFQSNQSRAARSLIQELIIYSLCHKKVTVVERCSPN